MQIQKEIKSHSRAALFVEALLLKLNFSIKEIIMNTFAVHTLQSASSAAAPLLEKSQKEWGFVPTLHGILAESAPTLAGYRQLFELVGQSSFTPAEQQVAYLAVNVLHECEYCTAGHTYLARAAKLPEPVIQALRESEPIADARLQALRSYTEAVVRERGNVGDAATEKFLAAGFSKAQALEVVLIIATKTISNYVNHIAHTPKESFMSDPALGWIAPSRRLAKAA
jgi:AhpD family alkylhydroperoxidase